MFDRKFAWLLIGDYIVSSAGTEVHYVHPVNREQPVFVAIQKGRVCWMTWDDSPDARREISDWVLSNTSLDEVWRHEPSASEIALWDESMTYMLVKNNIKKVFNPRGSINLTPKTKSHTSVYDKQGRVIEVHLRVNRGGKVESGIAYRVGGIYSVRPSSRSDDAGFIRVDSIRELMLGDLSAAIARRAGWINYSDFVAAWQAGRRAFNPSRIVYAYEIVPISTHTPVKVRPQPKRSTEVRWQMALPFKMAR